MFRHLLIGSALCIGTLFYSEFSFSQGGTITVRKEQSPFIGRWMVADAKLARGLSNMSDAELDTIVNINTIEFDDWTIREQRITRMGGGDYVKIRTGAWTYDKESNTISVNRITEFNQMEKARHNDHVLHSDTSLKLIMKDIEVDGDELKFKYIKESGQAVLPLSWYNNQTLTRVY